jgi:two-component system nitrogen regulation response regulator GlnG
VILTDGDGIETLGRVRDAAPDMPVIILSAQNTLDTAVRASDTGAFEYFPKPFDIDELARTVRQAVGAAKVRGSLRARTRLPSPGCRWSGVRRRCRRSTG